MWLRQTEAVSARFESLGALESRLRALEGQRNPAQGSMSGMDQAVDHPRATRFGQCVYGVLRLERDDATRDETQ